MNIAFIAQAGSSSGGAGVMGFLPFILMLVVLYLLILRPQMKKQKEHSMMLDSLKKNDHVVTAGGIHGKIVEINPKAQTLRVQIAKGLDITLERSSISRKKMTGDSNLVKAESGRDRTARQKSKSQNGKNPQQPEGQARAVSTGETGLDKAEQPGANAKPSMGKGQARRSRRRRPPARERQHPNRQKTISDSTK